MRAPRAARRRCVHDADCLAHDTPLSAFVAAVVCDVGASPPRTATSPPRTAISLPANGGNCSIRGATRRRHADRMLLMLQNPHRYTGVMLPRWYRTARLGSVGCRKGAAGGTLLHARVGQAPINAGKASPTEPGQGNGRPAPRRRLWPMRRCAPIEKSQSQLIGRNAPSRVECSRSDAILHMGFIQSMALRRERASPMLPPSTMPGTEPRPTRCAPYPQARHPSA